ncbi:protein of unknown function (DUF1841) [Methylophaga frappieri]|uniref:DUF1841 domain-containing protein n=1 Tax=Methylophaga frappieri (strain ATCC BAA-2434 / DSM 25690 / JAM7) TaxID=754477 RepID=I1YH72_METFJ|nr:DUF1841 family protein [Methylophaga frappieri]AFJ02265.1 protein of unknown function (DUF1841) [Methylophaga frappieri]
MFGQDRDSLRRYYHDVWHKWQHQQPLTMLEQQIAVVIQEHPEYHSTLSHKQSVQQNYFVESGDNNPYLHLGLHLAIREQVATDRPAGIRHVYQKLLAQHQGNQLDTEHQMMDCLAECIWQSQRSNQSPDETAYLAALQTCCHD